MDASIARDSAARPDALAAGDAHTDSSTHVVGDAMRDAPERTLDAAPDSGALGVVDASTMTGKVMYGYQGWFSAPADGSSTNVFWHWAKATGSPISASNVDVDLWPDTRELTAAELFATPLKMQDGGPANVFSAYTASTVALHFAWMKTYGIDGVMLQRFPADFTGAPFLAFRNSVTTNVMTAAEATGRVFSVMYDVTGMTESTMVGVIESDWKMLVDTLHITGSDRYLHHKGRPLVTLWGLGFSDRPGTPADATALIDWFHTGAGAGYEASVMGGVCSEWRTGTSDCSTAAGWAEVYAAFDVVSPWTVGRYTSTSGGAFSATGADNWTTSTTVPDLAAAASAGVDYAPVIWPGFSWKNENGGPLNQIPRYGGQFYWRQAYDDIQAGATMLYVAMFDEANESTAMFKVAENASQAPATGSFLTLDADGMALPSDWYLRLGGASAQMLRREIPLTSTIPISP